MKNPIIVDDMPDYIPIKVKIALEHVRKFHPEVDRVVFWSDQQWLYCDESLDGPTFDKGIDVNILDDALDDLWNTHNLPVAFQVRQSQLKPV